MKPQRVMIEVNDSFIGARSRAVDFLTRRSSVEAGNASVANLIHQLVNVAEWLEAKEYRSKEKQSKRGSHTWRGQA